MRHNVKLSLNLTEDHAMTYGVMVVYLRIINIALDEVSARRHALPTVPQL